MSPPVECPKAEAIASFVTGELAGHEREAIEGHIGDCAACATAVAALASELESAPLIETVTNTGPVGGGELLAPGTAVGRYVLGEVLGRGGMGTVYAARDPELDRDVAIKVVSSGGAELQERLLREAQAMAKLRHPNVLTIYDVGTRDDGVFLAMELVEGRTLRAWWAERERPWREVVGAFVQAGRGLEAAHQAKLIHRDFKPENVLVDQNERVLVTDFGLARLDSEPAEPTAVDEIDPPLLASLTMTGFALGTPAYMPPEQHAGEAIDARADVFAFAATLFEALAGERPFAGATVAELREAKAAGQVRELPRKTDVPSALWRAITAALSPDPADRPESIGALLGDLERHLARRGRWRFAAGGIAVAAVAAAFATNALAGGQIDTGPRCDGGVFELAETWSPERAAAIRAAFTATGAAGATDASARVIGALEDYAGRWTAAHASACEATHVRGVQSAEVLDLRMACLNDRRRDLASTVDALTHVDAKATTLALDAVGALSGVETCGDPRWLVGKQPLPDDPEQRERIEALYDRVREARLLVLFGRSKEAEAITEDVLPEAKKLYAPLEAEALMARASAIRQLDRMGAIAATFDALVAAERGRDERSVIDAEISLASLTLKVAKRRVDGLRWLALAEARLEQLGGDPRLEIFLLVRRGFALVFLGRAEEAREPALACIALAKTIELSPTDQVRVIGCHSLVGIHAAETGDHDAAVEAFEQVLGLHNAAFGADNPSSLVKRHDLARAYRMAGRYDDSLRVQRELLERIERVSPEHLSIPIFIQDLANTLERFERHAERLKWEKRALDLEERAVREGRAEAGREDAAMMLGGLATSAAALGRHDEALDYAKRSLEVRTRTLEKDDPNMAHSYRTLGWVHERAGRDAQAEIAYRRALEFRAGRETLRGLGRIARRRGKIAEALELHQRALESAEKRERSEDLRLTKSLNELAESALAAGDRPRAAELFGRSLAMFEANPSTEVFPSARVHALIGVARTTDDPARARKLATEARERFERLEALDPELRARIKSVLGN